MINNVSVSSHHLYGSSSESGLPYISPSDSIPFMGMVRCVNQRLEIWNGSNWIPLSGSYSTISMNQTSSEALDWAVKKMTEERRLAELAKNNVTVADAIDAVKKAQEQLDVIVALVK